MTKNMILFFGVNYLFANINAFCISDEVIYSLYGSKGATLFTTNSCIQSRILSVSIIGCPRPLNISSFIVRSLLSSHSLRLVTVYDGMYSGQKPIFLSITYQSAILALVLRDFEHNLSMSSSNFP